jgi:glycosyltransferase involved in cell wall biosynthesis
MMNIFIANESKQKLGGGFIFIENFKKGSKDFARIVDRWEDAHGILIPSVTMIKRQVIEQVRAYNRNKPEHHKRLILRVDNMPKDSRNRGTAFSRMKDYGTWADDVVFQSGWAKDYVGGWLTRKHGVNPEKFHTIINGVDADIFNYKDDPKQRGETFLYTTFNTDENKRIDEALYDFHQRTVYAAQAGKKKPSLKLVGQFDKYRVEYGFDFFEDEQFHYRPPVGDRNEMAKVYRSCQYLYFPAFADAAPNTVAEAMACGCTPLLINKVGGTQEVVDNYSKGVVTIQNMARKYCDLVRK